MEAITEGLLEGHEHEDGHTIEQTQKARQHPLWPSLRARLKRAPEEVLRIGSKLVGSIDRIRADAAERGQCDARREAREELSNEFSNLNAVHAFARKLIGRLRTTEEQRQATSELRKAAMQASTDLTRLKLPETRKGRKDKLQEM